jgi:hypothetical protein
MFLVSGILSSGDNDRLGVNVEQGEDFVLAKARRRRAAMPRQSSA